MIIAEWKPIPEMVEMLRGRKNILVSGCACCVAECAAGGEKEVETLAPLLKMALQVEGQTVQIFTRTPERSCEWEFVEELADLIPQVDAVISLACGIGIQAVAERFESVPVYPGVNTTALAIRQEPGLWLGRCQACGDCVLGKTQGLCPVARCAKSLQNGPCGGTRKNGKCEISPDLDCVWHQIITRAEARGELDTLREVKPAKNWRNSHHGGPRRVVREDLQP